MMAKRTMTRTAADNAYLHKDFHGALSTGLTYLQERYGDDAVRDYLRQFATMYYAPVTAAINERGLAALREHLERIYGIEGQEIAISGTDDELLLDVPRCPAVAHMRAHGYPVAALFGETSQTVYETICAGTPFYVDMLAYDAETGRARIRFARRPV
jgi:hypothetical protein